MGEGLPAHRTGGHVQPVVFLHPLGGSRETFLRAEIHPRALPAAGASARCDAGSFTERSQQAAAPSQPPLGLLDFHPAKGGLPLQRFFQPYWMACGWRVRTRA